MPQGILHHSRFAKVRPQQEFVHFKDLNGEVKIIKPADPEKLKLLHKEVAGE
jgi:hypothetical protein